MRTTLLVAISILAVAFAGCTEEPPKGEFSSSGNALALAGQLDVFESQDFNNPYPQTADTQLECAQDGQASAPAQVQRCDRPFTMMEVNFTDLADPQGKTYSVKFYSQATGNEETLGALDNVHQHPTTGLWMGTYSFDNTDDCAASKDNAACNKATNFDSVVLMLDDIVVGHAPLSNGAAFELDAGLLGTSFSAAYSGKTLTMTVAGLGNYTYEAWLVSTDADGVVTHDEKFTVVNGENVLAATKSIDAFSHVHIHVMGTKLNVAVATVS